MTSYTNSFPDKNISMHSTWKQQPIKAAMTVNAWQAMLHHCRSDMPNEACGVLTCSHSSEMINQRQNGILSVDQIYPISNTAEHANQNFRFDPNDWITILYRIQKNRQSLVGIYHSHPSTNPLPSLADLEGMQYVPAVSYWIVSFPHLEQPDVQPYWYNRKTFTPLMLAKIGV